MIKWVKLRFLPGRQLITETNDISETYLHPAEQGMIRHFFSISRLNEIFSAI